MKVRETYVLRHEGSVPGLPGVWPAGMTLVVDRDSETGLAELVPVPENVPAALHAAVSVIWNGVAMSSEVTHPEPAPVVTPEEV